MDYMYRNHETIKGRYLDLLEDFEKKRPAVPHRERCCSSFVAMATPEHRGPSSIPEKPKRAAPGSDVPPTPKRANIEEAVLIDKEELPKPTVEVQVVNL